MLQGDWGFSFVEPRRRRHADPAAPAGDAVRDRLVADPGARWSRCRSASTRRRGPIRSSTRSPARSPSSASRCRPSSPGCCSSWCSASSSTGCRSSTAPTSAPPAGAGTGSTSSSRSCRSRCSACSRARRWTRYVRSAVLDVIRLDYVTTARAKGLARARRDHQARRAQRADPGGDAGRAADAGGLRRRDRHRADLPRARHRLAADQRDPAPTTRR